MLTSQRQKCTLTWTRAGLGRSIGDFIPVASRYPFSVWRSAFGDADDIGMGASKAECLREEFVGRGHSQIQRRSAVLRYQAPNAKHRTPNAKRIQSHGYVPEALRAGCRSLITNLITDH